MLWSGLLDSKYKLIWVGAQKAQISKEKKIDGFKDIKSKAFPLNQDTLDKGNTQEMYWKKVFCKTRTNA